MIRKNVLKNDTVVSANCSFSRATTTMLIAVAMIAFMSIATKVNANPPVPPPDCLKIPFIGPRTETMILPTNCTVTVKFWYRENCNGRYDTYIEQVGFTGGPCPPFNEIRDSTRIRSIC